MNRIPLVGSMHILFSETYLLILFYSSHWMITVHWFQIIIPGVKDMYNELGHRRS